MGRKSIKTKEGATIKYADVQASWINEGLDGNLQNIVLVNGVAYQVSGISYDKLKYNIMQAKSNE